MDNERKKKGAMMVAIAAVAFAMATAMANPVTTALAATEADKRRKRSRYQLERDAMNTMQNNLACYKSALPPKKKLRPKFDISSILEDPGRNYMKTFTSLYTWEFLELAELLRGYLLLVHKQHIYNSQNNSPARQVMRNTFTF
jgi:hypothetical protein